MVYVNDFLERAGLELQSAFDKVTLEIAHPFNAGSYAVIEYVKRSVIES